MSGVVAGLVVFSAGALLVVWHRFAPKVEPLPARLARARGAVVTRATGVPGPTPALAAPAWLEAQLDRYRQELAHAADGKTLRRFLVEKATAAVALPMILLVPYASAAHRPPPSLVLIGLAAAGFILPDFGLREQAKRRREAIFLELPDALAMMALALGAGQSLRQALELAARDCRGPLGRELAAALTVARRERGLDERQALVRVAGAAGEPSFARFAELLAAKESPYLEFLHTHARQARAEQNRLLERAADRAYLAMHGPLAPLLATLVLVVAYGFLRFLSQTI
jgi:tight adherence protein C